MSNTILCLAAPERPRFTLSAFVKTDKNETVTSSTSKAAAVAAAAALMCWVNTLVTQPVLVLFYGRLSLILRGTRGYADVLVWTFQPWVQPNGGDDTINRH